MARTSSRLARQSALQQESKTAARKHTESRTAKASRGKKRKADQDPASSEDSPRNNKKIQRWSQHATQSPYPDFERPTVAECQKAYEILEERHGETVRKNFTEDAATASSSYPYVLDALVVALLSQATSWSNAKRAMASMTDVYGSPFEYDAIISGGVEKLASALRPGGMHNRKSKMLMKVLEQVQQRHGSWDLNHLFKASDEDAVKELISYDGVGPKSAYCVLSICLQRNAFAVDTHIYRIAGLWGWRPKDATRELAQAHLDARVPDEMKFALHYLLIVHGRECPACRGGSTSKVKCEVLHLLSRNHSKDEI